MSAKSSENDKPKVDKSGMILQLHKQFQETFPAQSKGKNQQAAHSFWLSIQDNVGFVQLFDKKINELKVKAKTDKSRFSIPTLFKAQASKLAMSSSMPSADVIEIEENSNDSTASSSASLGVVEELELLQSIEDEDDENPGDDTVGSPEEEIKRSAPKQEALNLQLAQLKADMGPLKFRKDNDVATPDQIKEYKRLDNEVQLVKRKLKRLEYRRKWSLQNRKDRKEKLQAALDLDPELGKALHIRGKTGRPRLVDDYPSLLQEICEVRYD